MTGGSAHAANHDECPDQDRRDQEHGRGERSGPPTPRPTPAGRDGPAHRDNPIVGVHQVVAHAPVAPTTRLVHTMAGHCPRPEDGRGCDAAYGQDGAGPSIRSVTVLGFGKTRSGET
jgi:hypothetical protein